MTQEEIDNQIKESQVLSFISAYVCGYLDRTEGLDRFAGLTPKEYFEKISKTAVTVEQVDQMVMGLKILLNSGYGRFDAEQHDKDAKFVEGYLKCFEDLRSKLKLNENNDKQFVGLTREDIIGWADGKINPKLVHNEILDVVLCATCGDEMRHIREGNGKIEDLEVIVQDKYGRKVRTHIRNLKKRV